MFAFVLNGDERNDTRLLDFTVVAVDSQGQPVNDLSPGEFQVTDAGKRQPINFFRHNDSKPLQAPALGSNEFSNRGRAKDPHVTLVLFDLLNERFATRGVAGNQIIHDLERLEAADSLYLYLLNVDGRMYPVRGVSNREEEAQPLDDGPWTRRIKPMLDDALRAVLRMRPVDIDVAARVQLTLNALSAIAAQLSIFPGRKNIVWVTDGVPIALGERRSDVGEAVDFTPQMRQLSESFDRSETAIYPVQQIMIGSPDAMGGTGLGSKAFLDELAGLTGGRPNSGKDIGAAVRQAVNDARTSYQIGYYATLRNWDSKFHKLRITCTRKGVRIQARSGYYAWPEPTGARAERAIEAAVSTASDAAEIGLQGSLTPDPKNPLTLHAALRIDANDVALAQDGDQYQGQLRIAIVGYQPTGRVTNSTIVPLDIHYSARERDNALREGIALAQDLTLDKNVNRLRFIVFDRGSNTIGSLTIPVSAGVRP
jgi:VWFA-related protein